MTSQESAIFSPPGLSNVGGKEFQEHHGWRMPALYSDPATEYIAAKEDVAVHDSSYVGRLKATGPDALDLLNRMSTSQVLSLEPGQGAPTILTTHRGRILDLIGVVNFGEYVLLLTSPGEQQRVIDWLDKYTIMEDMTVADLTPETTMLTVLGPNSAVRLEQLVNEELAGLPPYHTKPVTLEGESISVINRPLAEIPAFELLFSPDSAPAVWSALVESKITPIGLRAYQALRVERAIPSHGREMGDAYNPLEAGLIGSIDFRKGCYIGQEVVARLVTYRKVQKHLVVLHFPEDAQVSEGDSLEYEGQKMGTVTSVARIPTSGQLIGMGYVRTASASVGTRLNLAAPASGAAEIAQLPLLFGPGES